MTVPTLLKAYQVVKENEKKQAAYRKLRERPFTFGMAEELAHTALATGQVIEVELADKTKLRFLPPEDPLLKRRRALEQGDF